MNNVIDLNSARIERAEREVTRLMESLWVHHCRYSSRPMAWAKEWIKGKACPMCGERAPKDPA